MSHTEAMWREAEAARRAAEAARTDAETAGRKAQAAQRQAERANEHLALVAEVSRGLAVEATRLYDLQRNAAAVLQAGMLTRLPDVGRLRLAARYLPAGEGADLGGDWYDAFTLLDGTLTLVIGDVAGHDFTAAACMGQLRNLLRGCAYDRHETPAAVLSRLDRLTAGLGVDVLTTALVAHLRCFALDGTEQFFLRWSNAGHPPPLLLHPEGHHRFLTASEDLLLGVDPTTDRHDHTAVLPHGGTLLLYTDGLIETRGAALDHGLARLHHHAARLAGTAPDQLCDQLPGAMTGPDGGSDDIALLAVSLPDRDDTR